MPSKSRSQIWVKPQFCTELNIVNKKGEVRAIIRVEDSVDRAVLWFTDRDGIPRAGLALDGDVHDVIKVQPVPEVTDGPPDPETGEPTKLTVLRLRRVD